MEEARDRAQPQRKGDLRESRFNRGIESALVLGRFRVGFDLLHVSVGDAGCRRSAVVVGQSGIEGGEALTLNVSCR